MLFIYLILLLMSMKLLLHQKSYVMLLIYLILLLRITKPLLYQNIPSYVINIFNPPIKEHEAPHNSKNSAIRFVKTANIWGLKTTALFLFFWNKLTLGSFHTSQNILYFDVVENYSFILLFTILCCI